MAARSTVRTLPDTYFQRVKQFPLIHIRDNAHLQAAQEIVDQLLQVPLDDGEEEYLDVLSDLIEAYEKEHVSIPDASEADVLRALMGSHGLTQLELAKKAGISQSTISAVLNGTRSLTKSQVVALARCFHVSPAAFLPA